jgi:hypothetical protein
METEPIMKRWPVLAVVSFATALISYVLVAGLAILAIAVRRFGFNGMDVLVWTVTAICVCTMLGFYLGILSVYRYRRGDWTLWGRRLGIWGLVLNTVNGLLLFLLSKF